MTPVISLGNVLNTLNTYPSYFVWNLLQEVMMERAKTSQTNE